MRDMFTSYTGFACSTSKFAGETEIDSADLRPGSAILRDFPDSHRDDNDISVFSAFFPSRRPIVVCEVLTS